MGWARRSEKRGSEVRGSDARVSEWRSEVEKRMNVFETKQLSFGVYMAKGNVVWQSKCDVQSWK